MPALFMQEGSFDITHEVRPLMAVLQYPLYLSQITQHITHSAVLQVDYPPAVLMVENLHPELQCFCQAFISVYTAMSGISYIQNASGLVVGLSPLYSRNHEFLGWHVRMRQLSLARLARLMFHVLALKLVPEKINLPFNELHLTQKQHMILFLYARNYSNSEIAGLMTLLQQPLSVPRINEHLANLKVLLEAQTSEQLRDRALKLGFDVTIPGAFLPDGVYDITQDTIHLWGV